MRDMRNLLVVGGLTVIVAVAGLTGCSTEKKARESGRTSGQMAQDEQITKQVRENLATAPVYKFPDVNVQTYNSDVQLSGFVATDAQKQNAQQVAQSVSGVNRVINQITVRPESPTPTGRESERNYGNPPMAPVIEFAPSGTANPNRKLLQEQPQKPLNAPPANQNPNQNQNQPQQP